MKRISSKSQLAIILSKLEVFSDPKVKAEQYVTDSEAAASALWNANLLGDIEGKVIADLGCGTGILGIGAMLLGARRILLIDSDEGALKIAKNNILKPESEGLLYKASFELINRDIHEVSIKTDIVIQNPPFGTKIKHQDAVFLEKAIETAPVVYSFHKSESKGFLDRLSSKKNAKMTHEWHFRLPLKATFSFHRRQIHRIDVSCFRFEKS